LTLVCYCFSPPLFFYFLKILSKIRCLESSREEVDKIKNYMLHNVDCSVDVRSFLHVPLAVVVLTWRFSVFARSHVIQRFDLFWRHDKPLKSIRSWMSDKSCCRIVYLFVLYFFLIFLFVEWKFLLEEIYK